MQVKAEKFFGTTADKAAQTAFYSGDVSYPDFFKLVLPRSPQFWKMR